MNISSHLYLRNISKNNGVFAVKKMEFLQEYLQSKFHTIAGVA